jgi:hypothetical protein
MGTFITRFVGVVVATAIGTFIGLVAFVLTMVVIEFIW